jgi:hypothetical protein
MGAFKRLACTVCCGLFLYACAAGPQVIPIPAPAENAAGSLERLNENYTAVLSAISTAMVRDLKFPPIQGIVTFYSNYQTFEHGLAAEFEANARRREERTGRRQPEAVRQKNIAFLARQRAVTAAAVATNGNVLVHEIAFRRYPWSERVRVLAHEMTHVLQRNLAERRPASWENWMIEGFADWVAYKVLDILNIESFAKSRQRVLDSVIAGSARQTLPSLTQLHTQADILTWTRTLGRYAAYGQGMVAIDLLVEEKGLAAVLDYFRKFAKLNNRQRNFSEAFGETLEKFDARFSQYLAGILGR